LVDAELAAYGPLLAQAASTGEPVECLRDRASGLAGSIRELVRAVPTAPAPSGHPQVALMVNSLTEQMRAEQRLAVSEARLRDVVNLAGDAILAVRRDGSIRLANRAAARVFGREVDTLVDTPAVAVLPGLNDSDVSPRRLYALRGDERVPVRVTLGERGDDGSRTVIAHDLNDEERLAKQLMVADRLASLGTLAAGVGHEINNPLGFVLANLEFARRSAAGDAATALDEALEGVARIRSIVDDLRGFANTTAPESGPVDLEDVVRRALRLLNNEIRHRARLATRFDRVPRVVGQPARLGQVVTHLVTNALRAIPPERTGRIDIAIHRDSDGAVVLEVRDDGVGIPAEVLPRIFEPFFSMRNAGDRRGLGLALLHGIITSIGGRIDVKSHVGAGTRFRVFIPAFAGDTPEAAPVVADVARPAARRVLLVDDEPLIGRAVARMLVDAWKVTSFRGTNEAMAAIDAGEMFDVCLCDLMMPGDGGANFAAALRVRRPDLLNKTGFVTGGAFTDEARAFVATVSDRVLGKPFDRASLERFLSMLAAR
jgi:PAS domain S-box-containing protein